MYPYQRTPMGNPYILGIYGLLSPRIPREHNKYHGHTVRGTHNCPLTQKFKVCMAQQMLKLRKANQQMTGNPPVQIAENVWSHKVSNIMKFHGINSSNSPYIHISVPEFQWVCMCSFSPNQLICHSFVSS